MVTIKNVAKLANVSTGTVSNVLTGNRQVSDDLRQRVMSAIEELDYQTDLVASGLVTGHSNSISAVMYDYDYGFDQLLSGMDSEARENGYSLQISRLGIKEDPFKHIQALSSRRVDGIIWVIPETDTSHEWMKLKQINFTKPIVFAFSSSFLQQSSLSMDNFAGGYAATKHLIEHGCKRIGHISGPGNSIEARDRMAGWKKALEESGLSADITCECGWSDERAEICTNHILETWPDIDGLFSTCDNCALTAIKVFQNNNLRVPEDIKVIGFDDIKFLKFSTPALTTIRQDYFMMGHQAVKEMIRRIRQPESEVKTEIIPTKLIIRRSCGCDNGNIN